jgi:hypothetical protein
MGSKPLQISRNETPKSSKTEAFKVRRLSGITDAAIYRLSLNRE